MRRNDIVLVGKPDLYNFYGRINRRIDAEHFEVVYCGSNFGVRHISELTLDNEYKGKPSWERPSRFLRMPSLRKLKQSAAQYNKQVWKRFRNG